MIALFAFVISVFTVTVNCQKFGHYLDSNNKSVQCPTSCSKCKSFVLSDETCHGCSEGFKLSKDKKYCMPCGKGVQFCEQQAQITCLPFYEQLVNANSKKSCSPLCQVDNCDNCESIFSKKCQKCNQGYELSNDKQSCQQKQTPIIPIVPITPIIQNQAKSQSQILPPNLQGQDSPSQKTSNSSNQGQRIKQNVEQIIQNQAQQNKTSAIEIIPNNPEQIIKGIENKTQQITKDVNETITQIKQQVLQTKDNVTQKINQLQEQAQDKIQQLNITQNKDKVAGLVEPQNLAIKQTIDEIKNQTDNFLNTIEQKANDSSISPIKTVVDQKIPQLKNNVSEIHEKATQIINKTAPILDTVKQNIPTTPTAPTVTVPESPFSFRRLQQNDDDCEIEEFDKNSTCMACSQKCRTCINSADQCIECSEQDKKKQGWKCIQKDNIPFKIVLKATRKKIKKNIFNFIQQLKNITKSNDITITKAQMQGDAKVNISGIMGKKNSQKNKVKEYIEKHLEDSDNDQQIGGMKVSSYKVDDLQEESSYFGLSAGQLAAVIAIPIVFLCLIVIGCLACNKRKGEFSQENQKVSKQNEEHFKVQNGRIYESKRESAEVNIDSERVMKKDKDND